MNIIKSLRKNVLRVLGVGALLVLAACSTGTNGNVGPGMSTDAYLALEDRAGYEATQDNNAAVIADGRQRAYLRGEPVAYGTRQTGFTLQWNQIARMAYVYPGHSTGAMGLETSAMMAFATDAHGNTLVNGGGSPAILLANVATQEGVGRFGLRLGTQVLGAAANGAIAANIHAGAACSENCGPAIQVIAQAGSESTATGTGNGTAVVGTPCTTCGIVNE